MTAFSRKAQGVIAAIFALALFCAHNASLSSNLSRRCEHSTSLSSNLSSKTSQSLAISSADAHLRPQKHCIIFVLSHSSRNKGGVAGLERRNSIRDTWKKDVPPDSVFKFAMDEPDEQTRSEEPHQDILYLNVTQAGEDVRFGEKLLIMSKWAVRNFEFEYMLRVDDDNFLCFDHIVHDLRQLQNPKSIIWGWWFFPGSAEPKGGIESEWAGQQCEKYLSGPTNADKLYRPDEMGIIISANLIDFITSESVDLASWDLMDVSIMKWLYPVKVTYVIDNLRFKRGHGKYGPEFNPLTVAGLPLSEFCQTHLSYHKAHPKVMRDIWIAGQGVTRDYPKPAIHKKCMSDAAKSISNHPGLRIIW